MKAKLIIADGGNRQIEKPKKEDEAYRLAERLDGGLATLLDDKGLSCKTAAKSASPYHNSP